MPDAEEEDDLIAAFMGADTPMVRQRAVSRNVRAGPANSLTTMPTSGPDQGGPGGYGPGAFDQGQYAPQDVGLPSRTAWGASPTPTPAAPAAPAAPAQRGAGDYRSQAYKLLEQAAGAGEPSDADRETSNKRLMLGMTLQAMGGESLSPLGGVVFKQALGDPEAMAQRRQQRLESQAKLQELMAHDVETAEERKRANEAADLSKQMLFALKAGTPEKGSRLQHLGATPNGEIVSYNPDGGGLTVNGKPYTGPVMSQATLDKQATAIQTAMASGARSKSLLAQVQANPRAFGGIAALSGLTGQFAGQRILEKNLTPQERQVRGAVLREAAGIINDLYGAALTANEEKRASGFVSNPSDPPEIIMDKLMAAISWADSKANQYGAQMRGTAERRGGGAPGGARTGPGVVVDFGALKR